MTDFKVVDDALRTPSSGRRHKPELDALRAGKTVFVPLNGQSEAAIRNRISVAAARAGFKSNTRRIEIDGELGILGWLTPKDPAA